MIDEVAPGIHRISAPVPFRGLGQVCIWLLEDDDGVTMVDCGFGDEPTRNLIENSWDTILAGRPVNRLIVTHFHPDHVGNARFVAERWGIRPQMTLLEWMAANAAHKGLYSDDFELRASFYEQNGAPEAMIARYRDETILYHSGASLPPSFTRLHAGDALNIGGRQWTVMTGQGHSPDLAMLYCAKDDILIAGDQLLPKITPNVSVWPWEPLADPLTEFLAALDRVAHATTAGTLVLPSHRAPFVGAPARAREIIAHHEARLNEVRELLTERGPSKAGALLSSLFRRELDGHQINFAMGEALAHLNHLAVKGLATRHVDDDGTVRYALSDNQN